MISVVGPPRGGPVWTILETTETKGQEITFYLCLSLKEQESCSVATQLRQRAVPGQERGGCSTKKNQIFVQKKNLVQGLILQQPH